ncbi:MAG: hypothetical protein WBC60_04140 [Cognaticolwellia sp.]
MGYGDFSAPLDYYLCDDVFWNWDAEEEQKGEQDEIYSADEFNRSIYELRLQDIAATSYDSEAFRANLFFKITHQQLNYMSNRYSYLEKLPHDFAVVALQKNILEDAALKHFERIEVNLSLRHREELQNLCLMLYQNTDGMNVYHRVGQMQSFIHELAVQINGINADIKIEAEEMRIFLSFTRLHLGISDLRKSDLKDIKRELTGNDIETKSKHPFVPNYVWKANKKYTPSWKFRHLRSLLYYAAKSERSILKELISLKQPFSNEQLIQLMISNWKPYDGF